MLHNYQVFIIVGKRARNSSLQETVNNLKCAQDKQVESSQVTTIKEYLLLRL